MAYRLQLPPHERGEDVKIDSRSKYQEVMSAHGQTELLQCHDALLCKIYQS